MNVYLVFAIGTGSGGGMKDCQLATFNKAQAGSVENQLRSSGKYSSVYTVKMNLDPIAQNIGYVVEQ